MDSTDHVPDVVPASTLAEHHIRRTILQHDCSVWIVWHATDAYDEAICLICG